MSEVEDYKIKLRSMTYAQLIDEKARWHKQQSEATGEYGYWGGVTGQEAVEAELKTRTGKTYEILKPFVDETGKLWTIEAILKQNQIAVKMPLALEEYGFIKEIKDPTTN